MTHMPLPPQTIKRMGGGGENKPFRINDLRVGVTVLQPVILCLAEASANSSHGARIGY
jgi:hypothetical protein